MGRLQTNVLLRPLVIVLLIGFCVLLGKDIFFNNMATTKTTNNSLMPTDLIENFEISALEYRYRNLVFEENIEERTFIFIPLPSAIKRYAVQYDGAIKMGIDAKEIKVQITEQSAEEKNILTLTIPAAHVLSHEAPLNDMISVIFEESQHTEKFTIAEYANTLNEKKKETESEVDQSGLLKDAQQSVKKQLDSFLRAIPEIRDNYTLSFVLE